jgi:hypothetical protein
MPRWAVLRDLTDADRRPIGLVTEHEDRVSAFYARDCGLRTQYTGSFNVLEPDGHEVTYNPGDDDYFNQVVLSLSRSFLVSATGEEPALEAQDIYRLYYAEVAAPRAARAHNQYVETVVAGGVASGGFAPGEVIAAGNTYGVAEHDDDEAPPARGLRDLVAA